MNIAQQPQIRAIIRVHSVVLVGLWLLSMSSLPTRVAAQAEPPASAPTIDDYVVYKGMTQHLHQIKTANDKIWDACEHNLNVVVAFDVAPSMAGTLNDTFKAAWKRMIEQFFCPGDSFTVIPFAHTICRNEEIAHATYTSKDPSTQANIRGLFQPTTSVNMDSGATFYHAQQKLLVEALNQRQQDKQRTCLAIMIVDQERQGEQAEDPSGTVRHDVVGKLKQFTGGGGNFQSMDWKLQDTAGSPLHLYMYYAVAGGDTPLAVQKPDRRLVEREAAKPAFSSDLDRLLNNRSMPHPTYGWSILAALLLLGAIAWLALQRYSIQLVFLPGMLPGGGEPKREFKIRWWERVSILSILSPPLQDKQQKQYRIWVNVPYAETSELEQLRVTVGIIYVGNLPVIGCRIAKVEQQQRWVHFKHDNTEVSAVDIMFGDTKTVDFGFMEDDLRTLTIKPKRLVPRPVFLAIPIALALLSLVSYAAFEHSKAVPPIEEQNTIPPSPVTGPTSAPLCPDK